MADERKDLSANCDKDDENVKNDCWHCSYFLFPIGCMFYENMKEGEVNGTGKEL